MEPKTPQSPAQFFGGSAPTQQQNPLPQPAAPGVASSVSPQQFFSGDSQQQPQEPGFFSNIASGNFGGAAKQAMFFEFPIISDLGNDLTGHNQKTAMQQIGDAGLSALWFIPGFGEVGDIAAHAGEAAVEGAAKTAAPSVLQTAAHGAAIGYGADVSSKLASGQTDPGSVLTPGLGTVTGGIGGSLFPKLSKMLGTNFTQEGALNSVQSNMEQAFRGTKAGTKYLSDAMAAGHDPMGLLAHNLAIPDVIDTKFSTTAAQKVIKDNIKALSNFRAGALDSFENVTAPSLEDVRNELLTKAEKQFNGTAQDSVKAHINAEFDAYGKQFGANPTPSQFETIKEDFADKSNYDATRPGIVTQANKMSANHVKTLIESLSEQAGFPGMGEYNNLIAQHYTALDGLNLLDGNTIKGGRLGNMLRGHTVAGISAVAGGAMGGGFLGTLGAGAAGEVLSTIYSKVLGDSSLMSPWQEKILNRIATENPSIVQKLQALTGNLGDIAPQLAPEASTASNAAVRGATKIAAIGAAQAANANGHAPGSVVQGGDGLTYTVNDKGNYVLNQSN